MKFTEVLSQIARFAFSSRGLVSYLMLSSVLTAARSQQTAASMVLATRPIIGPQAKTPVDLINDLKKWSLTHYDGTWDQVGTWPFARLDQELQAKKTQPEGLSIQDLYDEAFIQFGMENEDAARLYLEAIAIGNPTDVEHITAASIILDHLRVDTLPLWETVLRRQPNLEMAQAVYEGVLAIFGQKKALRLFEEILKRKMDSGAPHPKWFLFPLELVVSFEDMKEAIAYLDNTVDKIINLLTSNKVKRENVQGYLNALVKIHSIMIGFRDNESAYITKVYGSYENWRTEKKVRDTINIQMRRYGLADYKPDDFIEKFKPDVINLLKKRKTSRETQLQSYIWARDLPSVSFQNPMPDQIEKGERYLDEIMKNPSRYTGENILTKTRGALAELYYYNGFAKKGYDILAKEASLRNLSKMSADIFLKCAYAIGGKSYIREALYQGLLTDGNQENIDNFFDFLVAEKDFKEALRILQNGFMMKLESHIFRMKHLEFLILIGDVSAFFHEAEKYLKSKNSKLSIDEEISIKTMIVLALESEQHKERWGIRAKFYKEELIREHDFKFYGVLDKLRNRIEYLVRISDVPVDYTSYTHSAMTLAGAGSLVAAAYVGIPALKRHQKKKKKEKERKALLEKIKQYYDDRVTAIFRAKQAAQTTAPVRVPVVAAVPSSAPSLSDIATAGQGVRNPVRPVQRAPISTPEAPGSIVPRAIPQEVQPQQIRITHWEDPNITPYLPETAHQFIQVTSIRGINPPVPMFMYITDEVIANTKTEAHAKKLTEKLISEPEIGRNALTWRTYGNETNARQLKYKIRIRMKGAARDEGWFARPVYAYWFAHAVHAYNEGREIVAIVWVFDRACDHDGEKTEMKAGRGVGELVPVINAPFARPQIAAPPRPGAAAANPQ